MSKRDSNFPETETRFTVRVDSRQRAAIALAAKRNGQTISDFVVENAYRMATELLADKGAITLTKKQVTHIFDVLDKPPSKSVGAVRKLLAERSVLEAE